MLRAAILVIIALAATAWAQEEPRITIGADTIAYPVGWKVTAGEKVFAQKTDGDKVLGILFGSALAKSAKDESDEMATMSEEKAKTMHIVEHSTFSAFNGKKGIRVFADLRATAEGMDGPISFYSWYIDMGDKAYTIKLKCPTRSAKELAKEVEAILLE